MSNPSTATTPLTRARSTYPTRALQRQWVQAVRYLRTGSKTHTSTPLRNASAWVLDGARTGWRSML